MCQCSSLSPPLSLSLAFLTLCQSLRTVLLLSSRPLPLLEVGDTTLGVASLLPFGSAPPPFPLCLSGQPFQPSSRPPWGPRLPPSLPPLLNPSANSCLALPAQNNLLAAFLPSSSHQIAISVHGKTNSALLVSTSSPAYLSLTWTRVTDHLFLHWSRQSSGAELQGDPLLGCMSGPPEEEEP